MLPSNLTTTDRNAFLDKASYPLPTKPIPHSPKIYPLSIPIPNPSVITSKNFETAYPSYAGYMYSTPGYSAFQPVAYPNYSNDNRSPPLHSPISQNDEPEDFSMRRLRPEHYDNDAKTLEKVDEYQEKNFEVDNEEIDETSIKNQNGEDLSQKNSPLLLDINETCYTDCNVNISPNTQSNAPTVTIPTTEIVTVEDSRNIESETNDIIISEEIGNAIDINAEIIIDESYSNTIDESFSNTIDEFSNTIDESFSNTIDESFCNAINEPITIDSLPNTTFQHVSEPSHVNPHIEIHSNVVIKQAQAQEEPFRQNSPVPQFSIPHSNITSLLNAAAILNKDDSNFWKTENDESTQEARHSMPQFQPQTPNLFKTSVSLPSTDLTATTTSTPETNKTSTLISSLPETQINFDKQILLIQNNNVNIYTLTQPIQNHKVTLPQNNEIKFPAQIPLRLPNVISNQSKELKSSNKVVSLKRTHQDSGDENDFENLITENQIYGNKIVVKEKIQGSKQQEQEQEIRKNDISNKNIIEKVNLLSEKKSIVLQPNIVYLSNVQFPSNLMVVKNNTITNNVNAETVKLDNNKMVPNENKIDIKKIKADNNVNIKSPVKKDIHILKPTNGIKTISNHNVKKNLNLVKPNKKIVVKPHIVYQVPKKEQIRQFDNNSQKHTPSSLFQTNNSPLIIKNNFITPEPIKTRELFLSIDPNLRPKIVLTNVGPKIEESNQKDEFIHKEEVQSKVELNIDEKEIEKEKVKVEQEKDEKLFKVLEEQKNEQQCHAIKQITIVEQRKETTKEKVTIVEEYSTMDLYQKRRRMRRLKYLAKREQRKLIKPIKTGTKVEVFKKPFEVDNSDNILTYDEMLKEIYVEFMTKKKGIRDGSDNETDYVDEEIKEYEKIIKRYSVDNHPDIRQKVDFLSSIKLATPDAFKDKELDLHERMLKTDSVASAYIAAGRLDRVSKFVGKHRECKNKNVKQPVFKRKKPKCWSTKFESYLVMQEKIKFLAHLQLKYFPPKYKDEFEKAWETVVKDKLKRNGIDDIHNKMVNETDIEEDNVDLNPGFQIQILDEIKNSVYENNNLIKKRLDQQNTEKSTDSIHDLAEKNFSELNRLSLLADCSLKILSGQNNGKRDLNPGFDSENIKSNGIKIPDVNKLISLNGLNDDKESARPTIPKNSITSFLDQPKKKDENDMKVANYISLLPKDNEWSDEDDDDGFVEPMLCWPGIAAVIRSYKKFEKAQTQQKAELEYINLALRLEYTATNKLLVQSNLSKPVVTDERNAVITQEKNMQARLERIISIVNFIRNC